MFNFSTNLTSCIVHNQPLGLTDRLKNIKLPEDRAVEVSPDSEDYLSALKTECDLKMQILQDDFEVLYSSAEDDPDILTRKHLNVLAQEQLNAQSQKIVDSHSKRRQQQQQKKKMGK
ncbi:coiled-coil domain-containing protein 151 isoform X4 [Xyrichtys novacula]|uniref:Coiled-coil domain-containing protein 151 isoform X4 n=1 Tax=Xyrichtys novacula TaxID=13765 RepID=A0AAV1EWH4_XYRNO|nr:coiled-coil domain-containing protein 151 isoform X4 [Xyrichtys novacula]